MVQTKLVIVVLFLGWSQAPVSAHSEHSRADSVEGEAMAAVVADYHRRIVEEAGSAYQLLAPAYVQAEMDGRRDPRRWRPSGKLPGSAEPSPEVEEPVVGYRNEVEVVHVRSRGTGGLVVTHEVGSYLGDSWDGYNVWMMVRVDGAWRIGASLHDLPKDFLCPSGAACASEGESLAK